MFQFECKIRGFFKFENGFQLISLTYSLSMSNGIFLGTWVNPRCAQSTVLEVHKQLLGHLPIDKEILTPTSFPGSLLTIPQSTKTTANPITNATEARIATVLFS